MMWQSRIESLKGLAVIVLAISVKLSVYRTNWACSDKCCHNDIRACYFSIFHASVGTKPFDMGPHLTLAILRADFSKKTLAIIGTT